MKKLLLFAMLSILLQGCKQYCFNCYDINGTPAGQKCFHTEEEQNNWVDMQHSAKPNQPTSCR
jgi:hypothetical protein